VPHQDPADLRVAPRARERAPCAQDELHRLRPGPGRHQRLRRHDEYHRDDQRDAKRDAEEHGQMPGLGRPQRLAHDQGSDEPDQARDHRPQGSDRQPEQPPRYPRQDRHQHDAGGQHDHREYDPVHTDTKLIPARHQIKGG
jgi:hypothetical protein